MIVAHLTSYDILNHDVVLRDHNKCCHFALALPAFLVPALVVPA